MVQNHVIADLTLQVNFLPRALLLTIPLVLAWMFLRDNRSRLKEKILELRKEPWVPIFFLYTAYILTSTVFARLNEYPLGAVIKHVLPGSARILLMNVENIIMFVPYTFLYLQAFKPRTSWKAALLLAGGTTVFIEVCQLLFWLGKFQLSDILYNMTGGIIGIFLWRLWKRIRP